MGWVLMCSRWNILPTLRITIHRFVGRHTRSSGNGRIVCCSAQVNCDFQHTRHVHNLLISSIFDSTIMLLLSYLRIAFIYYMFINMLNYNHTLCILSGKQPTIEITKSFQMSIYLFMSGYTVALMWT